LAPRRPLDAGVELSGLPWETDRDAAEAVLVEI
jgi:hypothetical protein